MKNKKNISIKLKKVSIANLHQLKGGALDTMRDCKTSPVNCLTTIDPRTDISFQTFDDC